MAIEALERAIERFGTPLYVFHEIVHNRHIVDRFRRQGVVFVDGLHEVPPGSHLMYSAHGVSPDVQREAGQRSLQVIDATCPLVRKVHLEATRFAREGYTIVLVGHRDHDEVVGTLGEAPDQMRLVENVEDVDRLVIADPAKVAYLTQTTLSVDDAEVILRRLRERFPLAVGAEGGHLLRHAESPGGPEGLAAHGRRGLDRRQPQQLEQHPAAGSGAGGGPTSLPDR